MRFIASHVEDVDIESGKTLCRKGESGGVAESFGDRAEHLHRDVGVLAQDIPELVMA